MVNKFKQLQKLSSEGILYCDNKYVGTVEAIIRIQNNHHDMLENINMVEKDLTTIFKKFNDAFYRTGNINTLSLNDWGLKYRGSRITFDGNIAYFQFATGGYGTGTPRREKTLKFNKKLIKTVCDIVANGEDYNSFTVCCIDNPKYDSIVGIKRTFDTTFLAFVAGLN